MLPKHLLVLLIALAFLFAPHADTPFAGKWRIDEAKSHISGATDSVAAAGPNTWKFQYGAFSWVVKADGTDQPTPLGDSVSMKVISATEWQFTYKSNGKPTATETWVLAADGNSMKRTFTGKKENGEPFMGFSTMMRTLGESGFEGTWESTEVKLPFHEVDIEANGEDGVAVRLPEDGTNYSLKFDGKEYPEKGPRIPSGMTVSAKLLGPREVEATTRINGKVFDHEKWEVSEDGTTFTYTQQDEGADKPAVIVLHRMKGL